MKYQPNNDLGILLLHLTRKRFVLDDGSSLYFKNERKIQEVE